MKLLLKMITFYLEKYFISDSHLVPIHMLGSRGRYMHDRAMKKNTVLTCSLKNLKEAY